MSHYDPPPSERETDTYPVDMPSWAKGISKKIDQILDRLAYGDTAIAILKLRVAFLEKIVYGLCGTILLTVLGAVVALVIKH